MGRAPWLDPYCEECVVGLSTEFKVGLFTILGLATLGGTALMLRGTTFLHKKNYFTSELPNASGVSERTQVRVAGVTSWLCDKSFS